MQVLITLGAWDSISCTLTSQHVTWSPAQEPCDSQWAKPDGAEVLRALTSGNQALQAGTGEQHMCRGECQSSGSLLGALLASRVRGYVRRI